ncbi:MAG: hypothetical protein KDD44_08285 [Bdellovibrionales bacterium]|nr:hypothetical protein [Bdellovibrionales bacterium]
MKSQKRECNGQFAVTSFRRNAEFERSSNDRSAFAAICDSVNADGWMFSAPAGFSGWDFSRQMAYVVNLFNLEPIAVEIPVTVAVAA